MRRSVVVIKQRSRARPDNPLTPKRGVDGELGVVLDVPQMAFAAETLRIFLNRRLGGQLPTLVWVRIPSNPLALSPDPS